MMAEKQGCRVLIAKCLLLEHLNMLKGHPQVIIYCSHFLTVLFVRFLFSPSQRIFYTREYMFQQRGSCWCCPLTFCFHEVICVFTSFRSLLVFHLILCVSVSLHLSVNPPALHQTFKQLTGEVNIHCASLWLLDLPVQVCSEACSFCYSSVSSCCEVTEWYLYVPNDSVLYCTKTWIVSCKQYNCRILSSCRDVSVELPFVLMHPKPIDVPTSRPASGTSCTSALIRSFRQS